MSTEAQKRAQKKYYANNGVTISLVLNKKTDADIIEFLSKKDNKRGYLKEMIRKCIKEEK